MLDDFPLQRVLEFGDLSETEMASLKQLVGLPNACVRQEVIRPQGADPDCIYLLQAGWACSAVTLPGGERQLMKIHLPGDFMGVASLCLTACADSLLALTPVVVRKLPSDQFGRAFADVPALAGRFYLIAQRERIALMDRLSVIGAKRATGRLAALLLELRERLDQIGQADDDEFVLRLTQDEIGDYLGLTAVHVNRTFRQLEDGNLISRRLQRIKLLNRQALVELSGYVSRSVDNSRLSLFSGAGQG